MPVDPVLFRQKCRAWCTLITDTEGITWCREPVWDRHTRFWSRRGAPWHEVRTGVSERFQAPPELSLDERQSLWQEYQQRERAARGLGRSKWGQIEWMAEQARCYGVSRGQIQAIVRGTEPRILAEIMLARPTTTTE